MKTQVDISKLGKKDTWDVGDFIILGRGSGVDYSSTVCRIIFDYQKYLLIDMSDARPIYSSDGHKISALSITKIKQDLNHHYNVVKHYKGSEVKIILETV